MNFKYSLFINKGLLLKINLHSFLINYEKKKNNCHF